MFNRGGFAGHVKAYNVAAPRFLHPAVTDLSLLGRVEIVLVGGRSVCGEGVPPRLRLTGPEEDQGLDSFTWRRGESRKWLNHLW